MIPELVVRYMSKGPLNLPGCSEVSDGPKNFPRCSEVPDGPQSHTGCSDVPGDPQYLPLDAQMYQKINKTLPACSEESDDP